MLEIFNRQESDSAELVRIAIEIKACERRETWARAHADKCEELAAIAESNQLNSQAAAVLHRGVR
jgi:hypothetical protein